jgi:hypothetical protein
MVAHNPPSPAESARLPVNPLPIALYVSDGLIFELYDGGQPCRSFAIRWERLIPTRKDQPETVSPNPQAASRTRRD